MSQDLARQIHEKTMAGAQALAVPTQERIRVEQALLSLHGQHATPVVTWLPATGFSLLAGDVNAPWLVALAGPAYPGDLKASLAAVAHHPEFPPEALFAFLDAHELLAGCSDEAAITRSLLVDLISHNQFQRVATIGEIRRPIVFVHPPAKVHGDVDPFLEPVSLPMMTPAEIAGEVVPDVAQGLPKGKTGLEGMAGEELQSRLGTVCSGLLVHQVRSVLAEACSRHGRFKAEMIEDVRRYRTELLNASGLVTVYEGRETFRDVGGLEALKAFLLRVAGPRPPHAKARPKGVMITGLSGTGKTLVAKALANETGRLAIQLNLDDLLGGIVGATESNLRNTLAIIDSAGAAVVILDEIEKMLAGSQGGGQTDGGVMSRVLGALLRWLNDHTSDVIAIFTSNDMTTLPTEFTRAERVDAVYFVDLPTAADREGLWRYYCDHYGVQLAQARPDDSQYTGADVATAVRLASLMDVSLVEAGKHVVPIAITSEEKVRTLRESAANRFLDAVVGGRYNPNRPSSIAAAAPQPAARPIRTRKPADPELN